MKPLIGVIGRVEYPGGTGHIIIKETIRRSIVKAGGNPICILLPQDIDYTNARYLDQEDLTKEEKEMLLKQINLCDGILMPGGFKTNKAERFILDYLIENNKKVLCICLGMQLLASYGFDSLSNELNSEKGINHKQDDVDYVHEVTLDKSSKLYKIIGKEKFMVNSRHKYHIIPNDKYMITSLSDDNIIESIEFTDKDYIIGVQWHPEDLDDEVSKKIFESFINSCKK